MNGCQIQRLLIKQYLRWCSQKTNKEAVEKNDCNQRDFSKLLELIYRGHCACFRITGPLICLEGKTTQEREVKPFRHTAWAEYLKGELSFNGPKSKKTGNNWMGLVELFINTNKRLLWNYKYYFVAFCLRMPLYLSYLWGNLLSSLICYRWLHLFLFCFFRNNELKQACAPEDKLEWFGYFSKFIRLTQQFFLFCLYFVYTQLFVPAFPSPIGINLFFWELSFLCWIIVLLCMCG